MLGRAEEVRVVLRETADAHEAVHRAGSLVPIARAELGEPEREIAIRSLLRPVDHDVAGTVHRLGAIALLLRRTRWCFRQHHVHDIVGIITKRAIADAVIDSFDD